VTSEVTRLKPQKSIVLSIYTTLFRRMAAPKTRKQNQTKNKQKKADILKHKKT
jgi:hypothetical protein